MKFVFLIFYFVLCLKKFSKVEKNLWSSKISGCKLDLFSTLGGQTITNTLKIIGKNKKIEKLRLRNVNIYVLNNNTVFNKVDFTCLFKFKND